LKGFKNKGDFNEHNMIQNKALPNIKKSFNMSNQIKVLLVLLSATSKIVLTSSKNYMESFCRKAFMVVI
jgi:hypothetical protein